MITQEQINQGQEFLNTLIQKSWDSPEFKNQLITNPKQTIKKVTGLDSDVLADEGKIIVEDQTNRDIIYLNIPRKVDVDEFELTDEQLDTVSGGDVVVGTLIVVGVLAGASLVAAGAGAVVGYYANKK
ncbi:hypothetical protein BTO06_18020 [Tenacibaculum sp. SZ-18]|uniref:TOMM propeptide domain-containing protein n=1 Tax=Tenacibaculum sp. SZ-18 TaxID=754423 RepID=UPI000C2D433A|nr:TOMM propeptide domain-containing protein [Tenacibaculum sp. SZ-18]AUC16927.1 hypothetical protein BTO06_18020 [Tenacibaculum sp. SZ-18]